VDDIVTGMTRLMDYVPQTGERPPCALYNIGNNRPVELMTLIQTLETCLGRTAEMNMLPMQPGDFPATYADVDDLMRDVGFRPDTSIEDGIAKFVEWYREYYPD